MDEKTKLILDEANLNAPEIIIRGDLKSQKVLDVVSMLNRPKDGFTIDDNGEPCFIETKDIIYATVTEDELYIHTHEREYQASICMEEFISMTHHALSRISEDTFVNIKYLYFSLNSHGDYYVHMGENDLKISKQYINSFLEGRTPEFANGRDSMILGWTNTILAAIVVGFVLSLCTVNAKGSYDNFARIIAVWVTTSLFYGISAKLISLSDKISLLMAILIQTTISFILFNFASTLCNFTLATKPNIFLIMIHIIMYSSRLFVRACRAKRINKILKGRRIIYIESCSAK